MRATQKRRIMPTFTCTVDVMAGGDETIPTLSVSFAVEVSEKHHRALLNPSTQTPALINDREDALAIVYEASQQAVVDAKLPCGACGAPAANSTVQTCGEYDGTGEGALMLTAIPVCKGACNCLEQVQTMMGAVQKELLVDEGIKETKDQPSCWYDATACAKCRKRDVELKKW